LVVAVELDVSTEKAMGNDLFVDVVALRLTVDVVLGIVVLLVVVEIFVLVVAFVVLFPFVVVSGSA
jgi:hypothetical protein